MISSFSFHALLFAIPVTVKQIVMIFISYANKYPFLVIGLCSCILVTQDC